MVSSSLARRFGDKPGRLPPETAHSILDLDFNDQDEARMHELSVRNREGAIAPAEKEELLPFANAGTRLAILQSRARRTLGARPEECPVS